MLRAKVTTKPKVEPVQLKEVKAALRIDDNEEDSLIAQYIRDAREMAETYMGQKFITQTVTAYVSNYSEVEEPWWEGTRVVPENYAFGNRTIDLKYLPVQSITQVDTVDWSNTETVYDSDNYTLDNFDAKKAPRMVFNQGASLPGSLRQPNGIKITYVAGYGDNPSDVPNHIRRGIVLLASHLWANRGDCADPATCIEAAGAKSLLRLEKVLKI